MTPERIREVFDADRKIGIDPEDEFMLVRDRTDAELADLRDALLYSHHQWIGDGGFTCDGCDLAKRCDFAFDPYNTNGDCLLSK